MATKAASKRDASSDRDIQSVKRALRILETVAAAGELGVTEIAQAIGLHVATVHNLLRTLTRCSYLENHGGRYRLGVSVAMLSGPADSVTGLAEFLQPWMERISEDTGEAASASVLSREILQIVAFQPGTQAITIHYPQWVWPQPLCLATGRVLVAELPEEQWPRFTSEAEQAQPDWSVEQWAQYLREIRETGCCVITHSDQAGQLAMGLPVRSRSGRLLAAVGASSPRFRATPELCERMFNSIREVAVELSRQFGCPAGQLKKIKTTATPDWSRWLS